MDSFMDFYNAFWHVVWLLVAVLLWIAGAFSGKDMTTGDWAWSWPWKAVKGLFRFVFGMVGIRF